MVWTTSERGFELIKRFEGLRLNSYLCPAGVWTVGYGTTRLPNGEPVREGLLITQERAEKLLRHDVLAFERTVNRVVTYADLKQLMFDAMVSLAYNIGSGAFADSTLVRVLNEGNVNEAAQQFLRWNRAGGQVSVGLKRRRKAERALFLEGAQSA